MILIRHVKGARRRVFEVSDRVTNDYYPHSQVPREERVFRFRPRAGDGAKSLLCSEGICAIGESIQRACFLIEQFEERETTKP